MIDTCIFKIDNEFQKNIKFICHKFMSILYITKIEHEYRMKMCYCCATWSPKRLCGSLIFIKDRIISDDVYRKNVFFLNVSQQAFIDHLDSCKFHFKDIVTMNCKNTLHIIFRIFEYKAVGKNFYHNYFHR